MRKMLWNLGVVAVVAYMGMVSIMYITQRSLMYFPDRSDPSPTATVAPEMKEISILNRDGLRNESWMYLPMEDEEKIIVMFHGNASNVGGRAKKARPFIDAGCGFVMTGYRGYGGNSGDPTEAGLYEDARAVLNALINERGIPPSRIVLYGESLGTGVATKMAREFPNVSGLILEVPYDSALAVAQKRYWYIMGLSMLMKDQYRSDLRVPELTMPKLMIAAGRDEEIPPEHARHLFALAAEPKTFLEIPDGGHDNLYDFGVADKMIAFIQGLP